MKYIVSLFYENVNIFAIVPEFDAVVFSNLYRYSKDQRLRTDIIDLLLYCSEGCPALLFMTIEKTAMTIPPKDIVRRIESLSRTDRQYVMTTLKMYPELINPKLINLL